MKSLTIQEIITATGGTLLSGDPKTVVRAVCTDTRKIVPGALFVPIVGQRFDAHDFLPHAFCGGCVAALTEKVQEAGNHTLVLVADTRKALGDLAAFYRQKFTIPFIAITGSVGKTTVKELTAAVLSTQKNVLKTDGNFNNDIGLPLTLFRLEEGHEAAIIEMGMSARGEIDALARITKPHIGIVTNIGLSHIENLGSQENIYRAKAELFSHVAPDGTIILNGDDPQLVAHREEIAQKTVSVGLTDGNDITAKNITATKDGVSFTAVAGPEEAVVNLKIPGEHNVINALMACAVGKCLGIPLALAARGLGEYVSFDKRMQLIVSNGLTIINDCYNAAPASVEAALKVLCAHSGRKIAVLGDIKELGDYTKDAHINIGLNVAQLGIDALFTFGESAALSADSAQTAGLKQAFAFTEIEKLLSALGDFIRSGDTVLIKGSRAMRLERVTEFLTTAGKSR